MNQKIHLKFRKYSRNRVEMFQLKKLTFLAVISQIIQKDPMTNVGVFSQRNLKTLKTSV